MACPARTYPLRQPPNHKPPIPRWQLVLGDNVSRVFTAYIGIQPRGAPQLAVDKAAKNIQRWMDEPSAFRPQAFETFGVINGDDTQDAKVWACYWDNEACGKEGLQRLNLPFIYSTLSATEPSTIGLWSESFSTLVSRLETNYTGLDYLPGIAKLPGTTTEQHNLTAYWGAARDRIPDSAHDLFKKEDTVDSKPELVGDSTGKHLVGTNYNNMVQIRSGQYWETCGPEETASYRNNLEPTLNNGLQYLWDNRNVSGAMGLRYLRNTDGSSKVLKETCGAGFFCNLQNLEDWAKSHPSHLAIYTGAIRHAKKFGAERKFRTWHEVSILKEGEARFDPREVALPAISTLRRPHVPSKIFTGIEIIAICRGGEIPRSSQLGEATTAVNDAGSTRSGAITSNQDVDHAGLVATQRRAFGRAGVWPKPPVDAGCNKASPISPPSVSLPLPRIHASGFLNTSTGDFEHEYEQDGHGIRPNQTAASKSSKSQELIVEPTDVVTWLIASSLTDPFAANLHQMDAHLVSYYVYRVCPLTVPCADYLGGSPFSALLVPFAVSSSSSVIWEALLGLAASHRSRSDSSYQPVAISYYRRTLNYLRMCLATQTPRDLVTNPETLVLVMLLCQHELTKDDGRNWVIHLRGARNLIRYQNQLQHRPTNDHDALTRQCKHPWERITLLAERYFAFCDVMGRTACGEEPIFGNSFWDSQDDSVDPWMGCSPRLVSIISAVTELSRKYERHNRPHMRRQELDTQFEKLQDRLQQSAPKIMETGSNEEHIMWHCAELKRLTVDLYIHAALRNSTPATPAIKDKIRNMLHMISKLLRLGITAGLIWPLFMAACQLDPAEELEWAMGAENERNKVPRFARPFILFVLDQLSDSLSSVARTRLVIEKVWRKRETALLAAHSAQRAAAFNDWAFFVAPLCHNLSVI